MKKAFTLAEVLITLGVIGVVAALTMPSLISKYKEKETIVKVKKAYSVFSQAYQRAITEYGAPENWGSTEAFYDNLIPYLNISKKCAAGGCAQGITYKHLRNTNYGTINFPLMLADGTMFDIGVTSTDCTQTRGSTVDVANACGILRVDLNGPKPPNQFGKDFFQFTLYKEKLMPEGIPGHIYANNCKVSDVGYGCAGWVILNENMDYLHCSDLSWDGKTKCD